MGIKWLQDRIKFLESYLEENKDCPNSMKERDKNLILLLKKFSVLPVKQQEKMKPMLMRTFERHKEITKCILVCDNYFENHTLSLNLEQT